MQSYVVSTHCCLQYNTILDALYHYIWLDVSPDAFFVVSFSLHRLSQRCAGAEGVRGKAQAAAAGVCTQGEHPGHAACHQGAGDARVHSMYIYSYT